MLVYKFPYWICSLGLVFTCAANGSQAAGAAGWTDAGNAVLVQEGARLGWTQSDNGQELNWDEAKAHCAELGAGWRLPKVDELAAIVDKARTDGDSAACGNARCKVPPLFRLSGSWHWSGSDLKKDGAEPSPLLAWGVQLVNGSKNQTFKFMPHGARALCVRLIGSVK
ncbi:hypothetical protein ASD15_30215 [Massilia sp. Root351]|uniref:Lcl domain-containing protein n=1 Tax=Massilia sp. Root351 TaxID=1736522 RepID=UPI00070A1D78|nr:DUF1566 domain-containing protein [Massilia sp. Root351]KQV85900.1 hypothetical protein ASD15_30215 [Massilia sp. Root351]